jgi:hypothetical protein
MKIAGPLSIGLRADHIRYLTPDAHTNSQEPIRDQTLRPVQYQGLTTEVYSQSKWEREAVNATILTPQITLNFDGIGGFSIAVSQAWYDQPVDRQGKISDSHFNVIASTFINYRFKH